jgi:magnesium-transporting ATPase (P-type)
MTNSTAEAPHARSHPQVLLRLGSQPDGLTSAEGSRRLAELGPNRLPVARGESAWRIAWRQINNPISWVLVGAGVLALALRQTTDAAVVFAAVLINAAIGFIQEWRAGRAIAALSAMVADASTVLRDGRPQMLPAESLVVGDVVVLAGGDKVPADLRLIEAKNLRAEEAALTGESVPVTKQIEAVAVHAALGDRLCLAFAGTHITQGGGRGVVVATGAATELGRINALLQSAPSLETPLTQQLAHVGRWITIGVLVLSAALFAYSVWVKGGKYGEAALTAVTLAVAAIPEGLPAIITIALAIGVRRMAARRAVVRQLPAVETLGSTSAICSDKTGTLTRNEMTVQAIWCNDQQYRVSGIGYAPEGRIEQDDVPVAQLPDPLRELLIGGCLCNDAGLDSNADGSWRIAGDPTEAALLTVARKAGLEESRLRADQERIDAVPFESEHRFMATLHRSGDGVVAWMKGAPETVAARCRLSDDARSTIRAIQESFAQQGLRVLALARKPGPQGMGTLTPDQLAADWSWCGLVGMLDPPRQEAMAAIRECHAAGISVTMITGDHPATAAAIGRELGLGGSTALTGNDLDRLDAEGWRNAVRDVRVFARVAPEHKIRLVETLQEAGHVVAMTGDGVNDAPALKRANIGVAMGITGTAVSKEAAKIVLTDDNFATIAAAVEEGRRVYDNLIKALAFLLPTNLGLALILAASTLFFPVIIVEGSGAELLLPMSPTQILWINLVASVALSLPMAFETLEPGAMRRPPRRRDEPIFSTFVIWRTVLVAVLMAAGTCLLFLWEFRRLVPETLTLVPAEVWTASLAEAQSIAVTTVALFQACYLLHCRSLHGGLGAVGWFSNPVLWPCLAVLIALQAAFVYLPFMQSVFGTAHLDIEAWWHALLPGLAVLLVIDIEKRIRRFTNLSP